MRGQTHVDLAALESGASLYLHRQGWHHLAVTLGTGSTYTGTLYIDKVAVGTNTAMTLRPSNLGATANNFIGKSQFVDPYLDGFVDDLRIYRRALTAAEIGALP